MEALFLEDAKPVAIFDAPVPELVALRLLTALWPSIRARFSFSTFALSPRKVDGRFFDLVFAPQDAKPRFSDWPGRRVNGKATHDERHRWTGTIFERVFQDPFPKLMTDRQLGIVGKQEQDTASALRIALLWEELHDKLDRVPTAALGLLDIANSRMSSNPTVALELVPLLRSATQRVITTLSESDAWDYIGALVRKMRGVYSNRDFGFVFDAVEQLARLHPSGAIALLGVEDQSGAIETLMPAVAAGIAENFEQALPTLKQADPTTFARLISVGGRLAEQTARTPDLLVKLANELPVLSQADAMALSSSLLPLLLWNEQLPLAAQLIGALDEAELLAEVRHLGSTTGFRTRGLFEPIATRAREIGAVDRLRQVLLETSASPDRDAFVAATLSPTLDDVRWLLAEPRLSVDVAGGYLLGVLRSSNDSQRRSLLSVDTVLARVPDEGAEQLLWAAKNVRMSLDLFLVTVFRLLKLSDERTRRELAALALGRCLAEQMRAHEVEIVGALFDVLGKQINVAWVARVGLSSHVSSELVSRNLEAMNSCSPAAREQFVSFIIDIAEAMTSRYSLELSAEGAEACASLMYSAQVANLGNALAAAGRLVPATLRARRLPVSPLVAATFPIVYRELAAKEEVPDLFRLVPFLDWDKCKAARRELVEVFLISPSWAPEDFALTAYQCMDMDRIFNRTREAQGGKKYLDFVETNAAKLESTVRDAVVAALHRVRSGKVHDT
ncbi:hypothetical protein CTTA_4582 [Comamonas testosteroni]|uniref:Uncharacterized protein n=1 Tax=Comamonas testosteroni TaxID=285 RepID=A0A5A7MIC9_COMTE|nr:hypothetical protein [Comamonas testosteroni]GEQ77577.1 hypothetical protein CTTA_4582 [Comamonas testosteroni]